MLPDLSVSKRLTVCTLLLLLIYSAQAQVALEGVVVDAVTGESLPAAHVQLVGSTEGTITNTEGRFSLAVPRFPVEIAVRFIGYESARVTVNEHPRRPLKIELAPSVLEMQEVVVSGEDPAYNIMRKVVAKKAQWETTMPNYRAEAYSRFLLYREQDLVQVRETIGESFWRPGDGAREVVRAKRLNPRNSGTFSHARQLGVPNFYDDNIDVKGFRLVGPTHPNATEWYTFTLAGHRQHDGQVVYDIYMAPKRLGRPGFVGVISVLDEAYVLLQVKLRPASYYKLPPPIDDWSIAFEQQFAPYDTTHWLPVDVRIEGSVALSRGGMSYPRARYEQVSRLTGHFIGFDPPDSLFASDTPHLVEQPFAEGRSYLFQGNPGMIPLTPSETEAIAKIDPKMTIAKAFRPRGVMGAIAMAEPMAMNMLQYALHRTLKDLVSEDLAVEEEDDTERSRTFSLARTLYDGSWSWYNRVDGLHAGLQHRQSFGTRWSVDAGVGYAFAREALSSRLNAQYRWGTPRNFRWLPRSGFVRLGTGHLAAPRYQSYTHNRLLNTVSTYLGYDDYFDYYERDYLHAEVGATSHRLRTTLAAGVQLERHRSLNSETDFEGWLLGDGQRPNPVIDEGDFVAWTLGLEVGDAKLGTGETPLSHFDLTLTRASDHALGGTFDFDRIDGKLNLDLPTFFRRQAWGHRLRIFVQGGYTLRGEVPVQRLGIVDNAIGPYSPLGGFRAYDGLPREGEHHVGAFWEHDFTTWPFEALGLWFLADNNIGLRIHGGHGRTWLSEERRRGLRFVPSYEDRFHHELGVSVTNVFGFPLRIGATYRLDAPGWFWTFGLSR